MDNTYYILAKEQLNIERLHICTWEFPRESSYIEFGMEFSYNNFNGNCLELYLTASCFTKNDGDSKNNSNVICLYKNLKDLDNARFIFNDVALGTENVSDNDRNGTILKFEKRESLTVLPCNIKTDNGFAIFTIKKPDNYKGNMYFRVLVKLDKSFVAIQKKRNCTNNICL